MPYPKRFYRKRRTGRKTAWYDKKYSTRQLASKAWKAAKYIKSVINVEKKIHDTTISQSPNTTGGVIALASVAQGDTINTRDGNSLKATYLGLHFSAYASSSEPNTSLRCIVFKDNQQVGDTTPSLTSLLESAGVNTFLNQANLGRYSVIYDKVYNFSNTGTLTQNIHIDLPMQHHIRYNGTTAGDIQKGGLYFGTVSNQPTNTPTLTGVARLRYVDN